MTENTVKEGSTTLLNSLESELRDLIKDESIGMEDLASFGKNLTRHTDESPLTEKNLEQLKADLQNGWLVDFEGGMIDNERFGFEVIGNDIKPTITPKGDAIIPINFRYQAQRRTKLLILHIINKNGGNIYELPWGENIYEITIKNQTFTYKLIYDNQGFHLILKK